jgi:hypothetical protein
MQARRPPRPDPPPHEPTSSDRAHTAPPAAFGSTLRSDPPATFGSATFAPPVTFGSTDRPLHERRSEVLRLPAARIPRREKELRQPRRHFDWTGAAR